MNYSRTVKWSAAIALVVGGCVAAPLSLAIEPGNVRAGPFYIAPMLDVNAHYVDNLFRSRDDEKNTWVTEYAPEVQAWLQNGMNIYALSYRLVDSNHASSHDDDYTDHQVNLDIHHEFNARNVLNLFGEFYDGHEERGTGLSEGIIAGLIDEPIEYERTTFGGDYTYGNRTSRGRLELFFRSTDYDYQNFREFTRFRDYQADTLGTTFFWKVAPRTDALAEVRFTDTDYDTTDPGALGGSLDSDEANYLVGLAWNATARTSGSVRVGMYDRDYDSSGREGDDDFHWEVDLTWKPRTYSIFNLETRRRSEETNGLGDYIDSQEIGLSWDHKWNLRSSTFFSALAAEDDYAGAQRSDDRVEVEASYQHEFRRWFDMGIGYRYEKRDSDFRSLDYDLNLFFIEAKLSL